MPRLTFALLIWLALALTSAAQAAGDIAPGKRFVSVAFHDVVDDPARLDGDAVTTDRLVAFFDYLRGAGWTAISLDDVDAANRGVRPLPDKAILITFDDGYLSLYTRVFPLALAYRMPIVEALMGGWVDAPAGALVLYGDKPVPRETFVTWDQVREMQRSGLIEIASHSYGLHQGVPANPQGNTMPAAVTRIYADGRYEDAAGYRQRLIDDMTRSRDQIARETGQAPRAMVWPFGRYTLEAVEVAQSLGYRFALTLDPEPADAAVPMALARYLPTIDPPLSVIERNLRFVEERAAAQRLVCVDPAKLWTGDLAGTDERLGKLIERVRKLGTNTVVIDAAQSDAEGRLTGAWFPNSQLPMTANLLSRLAWQLQTRGGVEAYVRLPAQAALQTLGDPAKVRLLFRELGVQVPATGLLIEGAPGLLALAAEPGEGGAMPWQTHRLRLAQPLDGLGPADRLGFQAYGEAAKARPRLKLALLADPGTPMKPSALADLTLFQVAPDPAATQRVVERFTAERPPGNNVARRMGPWLAGPTPPSASELRSAMRRLQVAGGTVLGWCVDDVLADAPPAARVAPDVSSSTFPLRF